MYGGDAGSCARLLLAHALLCRASPRSGAVDAAPAYAAVLRQLDAAAARRVHFLLPGLPGGRSLPARVSLLLSWWYAPRRLRCLRPLQRRIRTKFWLVPSQWRKHVSNAVDWEQAGVNHFALAWFATPLRVFVTSPDIYLLTKAHLLKALISRF